MKIERLIGILSVLLQKDETTAPQLAEKFEVSRRTINRDIEELCQAGIPICTRQGQNGGISIMEDYKIDRTLMTSKEMQAILTGLRSLDSISKNNQYGILMEKLQAGASGYMSGDQSILIDLSSWNHESLKSKIDIFQIAIDKKHMVEFNYYAASGDGNRAIEPYYLIFQWSHWYIWGWCETRKSFRLFKLNRMDALKMMDRTFTERQIPVPGLSNEFLTQQDIQAIVLFSEDCKWKLIEEFGVNCLTVQKDGRLLFQGAFVNKELLISWLLPFGTKAELLEPFEIRNEIRKIAEQLNRIYQNTEGK